MKTLPRRKFGWITVVCLVVLAWLAVLTWLTLQPQRTEGSLGIDDETTQGAAGITSVLDDQGIAVRPAQSMTQLRSELSSHPEATVVFHDKNSAMQNSSYERLEELADLVPADQRVFAGVPSSVPQYLLDGVDTTVATTAIDRLEVGETCQLDAAREATDINNIRAGVLLRDGAQGCFALDDADTGTEQQSYAYAETAEGSIVFADWQMLSNAGLHENGTATLATWALGQSDTVIWFQPDFSLDPDQDGDLSPVQLPDWVRMSIVWAVVVAGIFLLYIGRRTGPVITEPLPAEVSAAETTVGRGRMYAKGKHHRHALQMLQQASLARLARTLQLGAGSAPHVVLTETAAQLHRPIAELHQLYTLPARELTSREFVSWAQHLQQLEHDVRDRFAAPTKES